MSPLAMWMLWWRMAVADVLSPWTPHPNKEDSDGK